MPKWFATNIEANVSVDSVTLEVVFEGEAVEPGRIDVADFVAALKGYAGLFKQANAILNGEFSRTEVFVESGFKQGSFIAHLCFVQDLAANLITTHQFFSATGLLEVLGYIWKNKDSVLDLLKMLKGHDPEQVVTQGDRSQVVYGGITNTFNNCVLQIYNDPSARKTLSELTQPLQNPGIEKVSIGFSKSERTILSREDEIEVVLPRPEETLPDDQDNGQRDAYLTVGKVVFDEKKSWTFFERGSTVTARIVDAEFWSRVHSRTLLFGEGDQMRVRLAWKIEFKNGKVKQENTILQVLEVRPRPTQLRLEPKTPRRIR